jgi:hypothetical protein
MPPHEVLARASDKVRLTADRLDAQAAAADNEILDLVWNDHLPEARLRTPAAQQLHREAQLLKDEARLLLDESALVDAINAKPVEPRNSYGVLGTDQPSPEERVKQYQALVAGDLDKLTQDVCAEAGLPEAHDGGL